MPFCGDQHVDLNEECDDSVAGLGNDGCSSTCRTETLTWTNLTPSPMVPRVFHATAYDSERERVVLFGGATPDQAYSGSIADNETWEWDGAAWTQITTLVAPPARTHHGMVFDSVRNRVVLFGGDDANGQALGATWEWSRH